jgi:hypothetical protein
MTVFKDSIREATAGALAGAVTKTIAAPLDRLKLVVQLRSSLLDTTPKKEAAAAAATVPQQYQRPWQALRYMIQTEGFWALWRGNVPTILINCGTSALNFSE